MYGCPSPDPPTDTTLTFPKSLSPVEGGMRGTLCWGSTMRDDELVMISHWSASATPIEACAGYASCAPGGAHTRVQTTAAPMEFQMRKDRQRAHADAGKQKLGIC
eukprot:481776-Rhodomonas_salina.1